MAGGLPDPIERRDLLHLPQKRPVDHAGIAERYLAAGRKNEALDFIERAEPARRDELRRRVRDEAVKAGDAFLLGRLEAGSPADEGTWRAALAAAKQQGKLRYALRISKRLGDAAEVERLEKELGLWKAPPPVPAAPAAGPTAPETTTPPGGATPEASATA